jgi:hypothetical protein
MTDTAHDSNLPEPVRACSLSGSERIARASWLERLRERSLGVVANGDGVSAAFAASDDAEAELRALAAAEARCCPFLTFEVTRQADRLQLTVLGPPDGRPVIDAMFEAPR